MAHFAGQEYEEEGIGRNWGGSTYTINKLNKNENVTVEILGKICYESILWLKNELKESAYLLEEIMEYLSKNQFIDRDECVELFNNKITTDGYMDTPEKWLITDMESLMTAKKTLIG